VAKATAATACDSPPQAQLIERLEIRILQTQQVVGRLQAAHHHGLLALAGRLVQAVQPGDAEHLVLGRHENATGAGHHARAAAVGAQIGEVDVELLDGAEIDDAIAIAVDARESRAAWTIASSAWRVRRRSNFTSKTLCFLSKSNAKAIA
jgi:hypothetical protein